MLTCLILVAILPSALSLATGAALAIGALASPPAYPVAPSEAAPLHVMDPIVVIDRAAYSPAPKVEIDRRGRALPPRDARGRFTRRLVGGGAE